MSKNVRIKVWLDTGFANGAREQVEEIDRGLWEEMTEDEQGEYLDDCAIAMRDNYISCGAAVIE
jgi:hypothetical protein